ncbi:MAG: TraR/DksA C4-type zinc finger protein [Planctomycetota bacterium]
MTPPKKNAGLPKAELDKLRKALLDMRAALVGDVSQLENEALKSRGDDVSVDHMADHGSDSYNQDQSISLLENQSEALKEIAAALDRMKKGTYGICEKTGKKIKRARLRAIPYARLSIEAQMEEEQGGS